MTGIAEEFKRRPIESKQVDQNIAPTNLVNEMRDVKTYLRIMYTEIKEMKEKLINQSTIQLDICQSINQLHESLDELRQNIRGLESEKISENDVKKIIPLIQEINQLITSNREDSKFYDSKIENSLQELKEMINQLNINQSVTKSDKINQIKAISNLENQVNIDTITVPERLQRVLDALKSQNEWIDYEKLGQLCSPALTKNAVRGYVSELIANFNISIEKKKVGKHTLIKLFLTD